MHCSLLTMTMPSGRFQVAPVGQAFSQAGSSHCMQSVGSARSLTWGYSPVS